MPSDSLLSQKEIESLKQLCMDPFIELGSMRGPEHLKCEIPHVVTRRKTLIISFPTEASARRWNLLQERTIRRNGHVGTAVLAMGVALATNNLGWAYAGATSAGWSIAKDELQATHWYPKMSKGWTLRRQLEFRYQQFPVGRFEISVLDVVLDASGRERERRQSAPTRLPINDTNGLPQGVATQLISDPTSRRVVAFQ